MDDEVLGRVYAFPLMPQRRGKDGASGTRSQGLKAMPIFRYLRHD